ncbi:MAG: hypothetical protein ACO1N0_17915 [Fluviicola sp.]
MSWVKEALGSLKSDGTARIRPAGGSMRGRIESGQLVTLQTSTYAEVEINDVIFIHWKGNYLIHLVVDKKEEQLLIGNNVGKINGWIPAEAVIAKVIQVED